MSEHQTADQVWVNKVRNCLGPDPRLYSTDIDYVFDEITNQRYIHVNCYPRVCIDDLISLTLTSPFTESQFNQMNQLITYKIEEVRVRHAYHPQRKRKISNAAHRLGIYPKRKRAFNPKRHRKVG